MVDALKTALICKNIINSPYVKRILKHVTDLVYMYARKAK